MPKPKILIIGPISTFPSGQSFAIRQILESQLNTIFHFIFVNSGSNIDRLDNIGKFSARKIIRDLNLFGRVLLSLMKEKPDAIHFSIAFTRLGMLRDALIIRLCSFFGAPIILHLHGASYRSEYDRLKPAEQKYLKSSIHLSFRVILLSENLRHTFDGLIDPEKIRIVHYGIPDLIDLPANNFAENEDQVRVLFLSNLMPEKGVFDAIGALIILADKEVSFSATFAGSWPNEEVKNQAYEIVRNAGLGNQINFPGIVVGEPKIKLFAASDVFLLPTFCQSEGQPLVIIEALRAGLPVISTGRGSIPEMVVDGVNGYLVPDHCPDAIAEKLVLLAKNPVLREKLAESGRKMFLSSYIQAQYISHIKAVFDEALSTKSISK